MHISMMHLVLTWQVATYIDLQQVELVLNRVRLVRPMMMILNSVEMPVLVLNRLEKFSQTRLLVFAELLVQVEDISRERLGLDLARRIDCRHTAGERGATAAGQEVIAKRVRIADLDADLVERYR